MKLTERLEKVASLVPKSTSMADIGTDHGYLPLALLEEGKVERAIACDINRGPLERAREHIISLGREKDIALRLGGGLSVLEKGEVDGVVIAGMGGLMMRDILEADIDKAQALHWLVLQPVTLLEGEIGVTAAYRQHPLFPLHIRKLIRKRDFLINGVAEDSSNERNRLRRAQAVEEKKRLEALL